MKSQVHVYCGPTISVAEAAAIVPGAVTHPPVRHGDLLRLDPAPGMTVVIIDGAWHQVPAVRHREILWLLAHGRPSPAPRAWARCGLPSCTRGG